jgi:hypothetical protein
MRLSFAGFVLCAAGAAWGQAGPEPDRPTALPPAELGATVSLALGSDLVGPWQCFVAELDNRTTRTLDVTVRIEDESYLSVATRREPLAAGARKRVFLYSAGSPFSRGLPPHYRISDASGKELASGLIAVVPRGFSNSPFQVGFFSRTPAMADDFAFPSAIGSQEVHFGRLEAATFPDRWIGLASLDLLVIHDAPLSELNADQGRALADYVRQGGTLVVSPGPTRGFLSHPVLAAVAPLRAGEPHSVASLPALQAAYGALRSQEPFLVHRLESGEEFKAIAGREIVRIPAGFGQTLVLSFDLLRAPFDTWGGRRNLWLDVVGAVQRSHTGDLATFPMAATAKERGDLFQQMARLINPYPSFGLILGLMVIFLIAVGPANYLLLWKLRRTLLLVVTIPAISLTFLGLIILLGYVLKGTTTVVHSARLLATTSGRDCAIETHLYSIFSPSTRTYDISFEPGNFGQPPARWSGAEERYTQQRAAITTLTCETGTGLTLRGLGAGQWQSLDLEVRALRDLGGGIRFELEGGQARIVNGSSRTLLRSLVVQTGREPLIVPFGEIGPGKSAESKVERVLGNPLEALGVGPDSLGDRLLRSRLELNLRPFPAGTSDRTAIRRYMISVVRPDEDCVHVDARASGRSQSIVLLHVAEGS